MCKLSSLLLVLVLLLLIVIVIRLFACPKVLSFVEPAVSGRIPDRTRRVNPAAKEAYFFTAIVAEYWVSSHTSFNTPSAAVFSMAIMN